MMQKKVHGMRHSDSPRTQYCTSFTMAKHKRTPYVRSLLTEVKTVTTHAAIYEPMQTTSSGSGKYFLGMTTREQRCVIVNILKTRTIAEDDFDSYV